MTSKATRKELATYSHHKTITVDNAHYNKVARMSKRDGRSIKNWIEWKIDTEYRFLV